MRKIILAVPKGRILEELIPLLKKVKIEPENDFFQKNSRVARRRRSPVRRSRRHRHHHPWIPKGFRYEIEKGLQAKVQSPRKDYYFLLDFSCTHVQKLENLMEKFINILSNFLFVRLQTNQGVCF